MDFWKYSSCMHLYTYIYTYIYTCICSWICCWSKLSPTKPGNLGPDRGLFGFGGESSLQHLNTYICIHLYINTCIYTYIHTYIYICIYMNIYIYIYVYVFIYIYMCIHMYIYVYIYLYIYLHIYVYMYMHIHNMYTWMSIHFFGQRLIVCNSMLYIFEYLDIWSCKHI